MDDRAGRHKAPCVQRSAGVGGEIKLSNGNI